MTDPNLRSCLLCLALACVILAGCDLFGGEEDPTIRASGTIVSAETGTPLEGLAVALDSDAGGFGGHSRVVTVQTASSGEFTLQYDTEGRRYVFTVYVNDSPNNPEYSRFRAIVQPGETRDFGVIELSRIED